MAARYPHNPDKDSSMSPASANTPISYRANVNRQKTKKWADAKPADYGGDDWGDDDEYDLPPPPISKPTGLRQQGQALNNAPKPEPPLPDGKRSYGEQPFLPNPTTSRPRVNSFDADDEKRNFSNDPARTPSPHLAPLKAPPTRFSQITGVPSTRNPIAHPTLSISTQSATQPAVTGLRKAIPVTSPSGSAPSDSLQLGRTSTGDSGSIASSSLNPGTPSDYQARRDFSPSAVPSPLQTRPSPEPPAINLPAQKNGPSQLQGPDVSEATKTPQETVTPKPWANAQPASPSSATSSSHKALPFIRPADIYRRMEEAREKQRQSADSSRLSITSSSGAKSGDRSESPAQHPLEAKAVTDIAINHRADFETDNASEPGRLKPSLEPLRERKSEYGFDGFQLNDPSGPDSLDSPSYAANDTLGAAIERRQSTSPQLPNLNRMSGFGMDFLSQSKLDAEQPSSLLPDRAPTGPIKETLSPVEERTLRTEPSLGFKSAVNQAFDRSDIASETSLPPTPSSRTDPGIKRSESESTSTTGISPIMSRVPSAAVPVSRNRDTANDSNPQHDSSPLTPVKESIETQGPPESSSDIAIFKPGHRRDMSAPSPANSPAKTPDLAQSPIVPTSQQAVLSEPSPTLGSGENASERLQSSQPVTEREQNVRPSLPGGWASSEETQAPEAQASREAHQNEKYDIMPTTTKRSLPQTSLEAAAVSASLSKATGAAVGEHDKSTTKAATPQTDSPEAPSPPAKDEGSSILVSKNESLEPSAKSRALPTLVMDNSSIDKQNDNLHKDIIRRLSSQLDAPPQDDSLAPENSDDQSSFNQARISSYLPSEYENYWAASAEEETPAPLASALPNETAKEPEVSEASPAAMADSLAINDPQPVQPLSPHKPEQTINTLVSPMSRRYSWEARTEDDATPSAGQGEPELPLEATQANRDIRQSMESNADPITSTTDEVQSHIEGPVDEHTGRDITLAAGAAAPAGSVGAAHEHLADPESHSGQRASIVQENDYTDFPHPVLLVQSEDEQHDSALQAQFPPASDHMSSHSATRSVSPVTSSQSAPVARIPTFKEIAAMDSTHKRIQTFDETRHRFAAMDSGLASWIETLQSQLPEHADVSASFGSSRMSVPGGSARSKYATGITQQPYYQQYLNASSPTAPITPAARPGSSTAPSSGQGFSPAGGSKLSTQQVQAKGKELLHTAGIFGGKAGKAGKGLLAKGKSRLRGGDKTPTSQQSKADRRSSLGLPRSSSRSSPPSRHSRDPSPTPMSHRRRASTMTLDTNPAQAHRPSTSDVMSAPGNLIAPWATTDAYAGQPTEPPPMPKLPPMLSPNKTPDGEPPESDDDSDVIARVGTEQSSSDTIDSARAHEEGARIQKPQTHQSYPSQATVSSSMPSVSVNHVAQDGRTSKEGVPDPHDERNTIPSEVEPHPDVVQQTNPHVIGVCQNLELNSTLPPKETLMVPSSDIKTRSRGNSSTSILDRPRYSYDIPRPEVKLEARPEVILNEPASPPRLNKPLPSVYFPSLINSSDQSLVNHGEVDDPKVDSKSEHSFEGLPPIGRISGIGFDFNPQDSKSSLPSNEEDDNENEEEELEVKNEHENETKSHHQVEGEDEEEEEEEEDIDPFNALQQQQPYTDNSQAEIFAAFRAAAGIHHDETGRVVQQPPAAGARQLPHTPHRQVGSTRPPIPYTVSPMHSIDPLRQQRENQSRINAGHRPGLSNTSDDGFRRLDDTFIPPFASPENVSDVTISPQRFSLGAPGTRGHAQIPSFISRRENQEERTWRNSWAQQPPSSAQKYPDLFKHPASAGLLDGEDFPPQYFHPAIPQVSAIIPRQQATEYQLPGVGPPPDVERPRSRRNSGFFKEIGERIRSSSRDRGKSISQDEALPGEKNTDGTREYNDSESSIASEDEKVQKRRNSFFAGFNRGSTSAAASTHESMVAHPASSRHDLTLSPPSSPTTPNDKKKSPFRNSTPAQPIPPVPPLPKPNRLAVLATAMPSEEQPGKKKRFSGLSSMFGKSTNHTSKGSTSESIRERPSIEPPPEALLPKQSQILGTGSHGNPRTFLSKLTVTGESSHSRQDSRNLKAKLGIGSDSSQARRDTKIRRPSGAGLLTGIMGRRAAQQEQPEETSSIRSKIGPPIYHPPAFLVARTYGNIGNNQTPPQQPQPAPASQPQLQNAQPADSDRGRRMSIGRQHPTVPTPNGYGLIRGEGAAPTPIEYGPRGLNQLQQADPKFAQGGRQNAGPLSTPPLQNNAQVTAQDIAPSQGSRSPNLTIESSEGSQRRDMRRLSRDDMLARSPARSPEGQQRPYQLTLPDNYQGGEPQPARMSNDVPIISPPRKGRNSVIPLSQPETAQVAIIHQLAHPVLRQQFRSVSPRPSDDVFSPANEKTKNTQPAAPPRWPEQHSALDTSSKLDRGNKAQVGQVRRARAPSKTLRENDVLAAADALQKEIGARLEITPSPSPPIESIPLSRGGDNEPERNRELGNNVSSMRIPIPEPKPSPDLYSASPRLAKPTTSNNNDTETVGKDDKEVTEDEATRTRKKSSREPVELDDPESHMLRRARGTQEEKILAQEGLLDVDDHEPVTMSATSYPGQEWNPYAAGGYEEFD